MVRPLVAVVLLIAAGPATADPHTDYMLYCRGCHLHTGEAVPDANVPSLHELAPLLATADGREYSIHFLAGDGNGNLGAGICEVSVPHDRRWRRRSP